MAVTILPRHITGSNSLHVQSLSAARPNDTALSTGFLLLSLSVDVVRGRGGAVHFVTTVAVGVMFALLAERDVHREARAGVDLSDIRRAQTARERHVDI